MEIKEFSTLSTGFSTASWKTENIQFRLHNFINTFSGEIGFSCPFGKMPEAVKKDIKKCLTGILPPDASKNEILREKF